MFKSIRNAIREQEMREREEKAARDARADELRHERRERDEKRERLAEKARREYANSSPLARANHHAAFVAIGIGDPNYLTSSQLDHLRAVSAYALLHIAERLEDHLAELKHPDDSG